MNKVFLSASISVLLFSTAMAAHADYSEPFGELNEDALIAVSDFIPTAWQAIALAQGDLNGDERTDYALVIQDTDPANMHGGEGLIANDIDANPRHLLLLFANNKIVELGMYKYTVPHAMQVGDTIKKLTRKRTYRRFIPSLDPEYPDLAEPFSYIGISEGLLEVKFEVWGYENSWQRDDLTFKFRYNKTKQNFPLINFEHRNVHKATGMFKDTSVDLIRQEIHKAAGSMSSPKHRKESSEFVPAQEWTPANIEEPLVFFP